MRERIKKEFLEFAAQTNDFIDFRLIENEQERIKRLLQVKDTDAFSLIGIHGSGSLICEWRKKTNSLFPIVWFDIEGFPISTIANNFTEFLSLLPYDTGYIYDMMSSILYLKSKKNFEKTISKKYNKKILDKFLDESKKIYSNYTVFTNWLNHMMKIPTCTDPISVIENAMDNNHELMEYLESIKIV